MINFSIMIVLRQDYENHIVYLDTLASLETMIKGAFMAIKNYKYAVNGSFYDLLDPMIAPQI